MVNELAAKPRCRTEETIHGWPATTKVGTVIKKDCETFGSQEYIPSSQTRRSVSTTRMLSSTPPSTLETKVDGGVLKASHAFVLIQ